MGAEQKLGGLSRAGHVGVGGHVAVQAQGHPACPEILWRRLLLDNYSVWLLPWGPRSLADLLVQAAGGLFVLRLSAR